MPRAWASTARQPPPVAGEDPVTVLVTGFGVRYPQFFVLYMKSFSFVRRLLSVWSLCCSGTQEILEVEITRSIQTCRNRFQF